MKDEKRVHSGLSLHLLSPSCLSSPPCLPIQPRGAVDHGGGAVWDPDEDLRLLVAAAIQRLKVLNIEIQLQGTVDPALVWIGYRIKEVEELLQPAVHEAHPQRVLSRH